MRPYTKRNASQNEAIRSQKSKTNILATKERKPKNRYCAQATNKKLMPSNENSFDKSSLQLRVHLTIEKQEKDVCFLSFCWHFVVCCTLPTVFDLISRSFVYTNGRAMTTIATATATNRINFLPQKMQEGNLPFGNAKWTPVNWWTGKSRGIGINVRCKQKDRLTIKRY